MEFDHFHGNRSNLQFCKLVTRRNSSRGQTKIETKVIWNCGFKVDSRDLCFFLPSCFSSPLLWINTQKVELFSSLSSDKFDNVAIFYHLLASFPFHSPPQRTSPSPLSSIPPLPPQPSFISHSMRASILP